MINDGLVDDDGIILTQERTCQNPPRAAKPQLADDDEGYLILILAVFIVALPGP